MKYIKIYENFYPSEITEPEVGDWIVAYRPYKEGYDNKNSLVEDNKYVIDIGKIIKCQTTLPSALIKYWSVVFSGGLYIRTKKHILYISKNKDDAEKHLEMLLKANKYNL